MPRTGRDVLLDVLRTEGVRHLFGNPGSTELPLIDALAGADDLHYVLCLQEATAVGMADGYAQATGRPAFLNLHTSAGLGNAIGNLTNSQTLGTPLVVTAGQQHYGHIEADPLLAGDLVGLARPVTKWAHEVRTMRELGTILRRAFHDAGAPPSGPVFVSLPMSMLDEEGDGAVPPPSQIERRSVPDDLDGLADLLAETPVGRLAIVAGKEVAASGAVGALVDVAEALGAPVFASPLTANGVMPPAHPLFAGTLAPAAAAIRAALTPFERVFLVGGRAFMAYPYTDGPALPEGADMVHLSPDPLQLGRTYPVRLGVAGDPRATLDRAAPARRGPRGRRRRRRHRGGARPGGPPRSRPSSRRPATATTAPRSTPWRPPTPSCGRCPRTAPSSTRPSRPASTSAASTTGPAPAATSSATAAGWAGACRPPSASRWPTTAGCRCWRPSATARPCTRRRPSGRRRASDLPVVFAVFVNRQYLILKNYLREMKGDSVRTGRYVAMQIDDPPVDYVALAESMGVAASRVERTVDIGDAVAGALASGRPYLVEIPISAPA